MLALLGLFAEFSVRDDDIRDVFLFELLADLDVPLSVALLENDEIGLVKRFRYFVDVKRIDIGDLTIYCIELYALAVLNRDLMAYLLLGTDIVRYDNAYACERIIIDRSDVQDYHGVTSLSLFLVYLFARSSRTHCTIRFSR